MRVCPVILLACRMPMPAAHAAGIADAVVELALGESSGAPRPGQLHRGRRVSAGQREISLAWTSIAGLTPSPVAALELARTSGTSGAADEAHLPGSRSSPPACTPTRNERPHARGTPPTAAISAASPRCRYAVACWKPRRPSPAPPPGRSRRRGSDPDRVARTCAAPARSGSCSPARTRRRLS